MKSKPVPAGTIPLPDKKTIYPPPFASLVEGRTKRKLGDHFGLSNFGVNLTELAPGLFLRSSTIIQSRMSSSMSCRARLLSCWAIRNMRSSRETAWGSRRGQALRISS